MSPEIMWIIFAVILFIIEAATVSLVTIWFAVGAIFAMIAALLGFSVYAQIEKDAVVEICRVEGVKLMVKRKD